MNQLSRDREGAEKNHSLTVAARLENDWLGVLRPL